MNKQTVIKLALSAVRNIDIVIKIKKIKLKRVELIFMKDFLQK